MASLTKYPRSPACDVFDEGVGLFENGGSGHSQGQTVAGRGKSAEDDEGSGGG